MRLLIALVCSFLPAVPVFAGTTITPTTTLAAETGNNTSTAATFQAQSNGNIGAGNVSKVSTGTMLYNGATTQIYAHFMPWFGGSNHMNVGYDSTNPAQVKAQVTDMISRGISGVVIDWYGPSTSRENKSSLAMEQEAQSRNGAFHFAIMEDAGSISGCANTSGCDLTGALISDLQYIQQTYVTSPAYLTWNGNPVIFYFGVESYNIDWTRVRANTASNLIFVFQNDNGFTASYSNAGFSWVQPSDVTSSDPMSLNYMNAFYGTAQKNSSRLPVGAAYKGFNDSLASWGTNRLMQQQCGQTWLSTFNDANTWWSTSDQLAMFQLVTWNDYEEATEIETGIDNCFSISSSVSGSGLSWSISGNENTIDHYTVFISADGQNLMSLGDYPAGTRSLSLGSFGFNSGSYSVYVKAVGKPSIVNHLSAAATYSVANGPVVVLKATPASGLAPVAVTASTAGSTDTQGTIVSSSINFGDGTVMNGTSAAHMYASAGTYNVTATLTDNVGLSASQSTQIVVSVPQPPVARLSLTPGSGTAPLPVTASTTTSTDPQNSALTSSINFGDGTTIAGATASHTYAAAGTYTVTATLTDAYNLQSQATATVSVNATASLNVSQPANDSTVPGPIAVVANGSAPSGVDAMQIYLDGALSYQVNASSFSTSLTASPGTHRLVVKLWDKLGNAYMQSLSVTVAASLSTSLSVTPSAIAVGGSVTATVNATSGTMTSSQINWGDGSSSAGPSGAHVYANVGSYTVTSVATSGQGTTSQANATVTVNAPAAALNVSQPANNASVHSPFLVAGSGSTPSGVDAMQIYLDGNLVYQTNAALFSTAVPASPGVHAVVVKLWDKLGNSYKQSLAVNVVPALTISLALSQSMISAGEGVTATFSAISGTIAKSTINWGDGTSSAGPSATHVYSVTGSYTITGTASDALGYTQSVTAAESVRAGAFVVLVAPTPNSSAPRTMQVIGYSSSPAGIVAMQIYLDGALVYQNGLSQVNTYVSLGSGTHLIALKAWDNSGAAYMQTAYVTAQ